MARVPGPIRETSPPFSPGVRVGTLNAASLLELQRKTGIRNMDRVFSSSPARTVRLVRNAGQGGTTLGELNIEVWDATGNKRIEAEVPDDVAVERILLVLAEKLHLPMTSPDGQLMSYKFHHRRLGIQLLDEESLAGQGVTEGDVVRIQPEITAGTRARR